MTDRHFLFSNHHFRALKGLLTGFNLGGKGWHVDMLLGILELHLWPWSRSKNTHTDKLSHPPLPPSRGSNGSQVLARGDLASINWEAERLPCLNTNRERGHLLLEALYSLIAFLRHVGRTKNNAHAWLIMGRVLWFYLIPLWFYQSSNWYL